MACARSGSPCSSITVTGAQPTAVSSLTPQQGAAASPLAAEPEAATRINVAVRCRPLSEQEKNSNAIDICRVMDQRLVIIMDPGAAASNDYLRVDKSREKRYAFDQAFGPETPTEQIFAATTKPLIGTVMKSYNATVFAYGSTGAGKTFTMVGTASDPGIMLRTVKELFDCAMEARSLVSDQGNRSVAIQCSFIEVYNENLRDLLHSDGRESVLDIRDDPEKGTIVSGITQTEAENAEEVAELIRLGNQRRTTEPTAMNVTSSRSHAVLQITVNQQDPGDFGSAMMGKLSMIDLAGSERASQTDNRGQRLVEGANINRSLLALGNCINALASGCGFVPYRDSKLTRLLKDSLGGNCRTIMVANISPYHVSYEDTLNTLKYANRAKNIRVSAVRNIVHPGEHIAQYEKAIFELRNEVSMLKQKLLRRENPPSQASPTGSDASVNEAEAGEHWKEEVVRSLECRTQLQRSLIEIDRGLAQWRVEKVTGEDVISKWESNVVAGLGSPVGSEIWLRVGGGSGSKRSLEDWKDHVSQIEESMKENLETRASIEQRLEQNKQAGRELQAQLPQRVLNEDLRAFLELIQRSQVLEVERLELDHMWERRRAKFDERDREIAMLRQQLLLRNERLQAQREMLSAEQRERLPGKVSILGSTLVEATPAQELGPLRVVHAWAPPPKDPDELASWDCRPLRERDPSQGSEEASASASGLAGLGLPPSGPHVIDWRNLEVPRASQIRGIARLQPPGQWLAPKGWREPEVIQQAARPPRQLDRQHRPGQVDPAPFAAQQKPTTGGVYGNRSASSQKSIPATRGSTCPPLRRPQSLDCRDSASDLIRKHVAPRGTGPSGPGPPHGRPHAADLRAQGVAVPAHAAGPARAYLGYAAAGALGHGPYPRAVGDPGGTPGRHRRRGRKR